MQFAVSVTAPDKAVLQPKSMEFSYFVMKTYFAGAH